MTWNAGMVLIAVAYCDLAFLELISSTFLPWLYHSTITVAMIMGIHINTVRFILPVANTCVLNVKDDTFISIDCEEQPLIKILLILFILCICFNFRDTYNNRINRFAMTHTFIDSAVS